MAEQRLPAGAGMARAARVIWDLTRIAMSGSQQAKRLIHDVIRASTAIPGAFPPVLFEVESAGLTDDASPRSCAARHLRSSV